MHPIKAFTERETEKEGAIKTGALNLTIIGSLVAVIGGVVTALTGLFNDFFGAGPHADSIKLGFLVAIIGAATVMIVADVFARAHATAAVLRSTHVFDAKAGMKASIRVIDTDAGGHRVEHFENNWMVERVELNGETGMARFLLGRDVAGQHETLWEDAKDVQIGA